jgi:peptide/nickel transport system substrate-binding protein
LPKVKNLLKKAITRIQVAIVVIIVIAAVAGGAYFSLPQGPTVTTSMTSVPAQTTTPGSVSITTSSSTTPVITVSVPNPDTLVYETVGQPDTLDPATDYETAGGAVIQNVYETLLYFNGNKADQVVPWLADSYNMSSDGTTYTFHIRSGITFTDGTPLDAQAVYFSLMRAMIIDDPDGPAWSMLQVVRGGQTYSKQYDGSKYGTTYTQTELNDFVKAKPVEVIDPMTVAVHLERPYAGWSFVMAFTVTDIVSPTAFKAHWVPTPNTPSIPGATAGDYHNQYNLWPSTHMVGTGPYILSSWDKGSQTLILQRNENYWGSPTNRGIAPVKNVIIKGVDDPNTRVLDFKEGSADIATIGATGGLIFQFIDQDKWFSLGLLNPLDPANFQAYPQCPPSPLVQGKCLWASFSTNFIGFNQQILSSTGNKLPFQPFTDIRIRKAFALSFNRTSFIHDVLQDFGIPATQIIPPGMFGYDTSIGQTPFDPEQAKSLLIDAGTHPLVGTNAFGPGNHKTIDLSYNIGNTGRETAATILANTINSYETETGLHATVTGLAWPQFLAAQRSRQLSVFFLGWLVDYVDPDDFLVPFAHGTAGTFALRMSYNDPKVTQLIDQQSTIQDPAQRASLINQIEQMTNDDWAFLWTSYGVAFQLSRIWVQERPGATVAGGIQTYNPAIYGFYFYELQKGPPGTASPSSTPLIIAISQLSTNPGSKKNKAP